MSFLQYNSDVHLLFSKRITTQCKSFLQTDLILIVKVFPRLMQYLSLCMGRQIRAQMAQAVHFTTRIRYGLLSKAQVKGIQLRVYCVLQVPNIIMLSSPAKSMYVSIFLLITLKCVAFPKRYFTRKA